MLSCLEGAGFRVTTQFNRRKHEADCQITRTELGEVSTLQ